MAFLQSNINGPKLEQRLGFLGLPFSQSRTLFNNCLLYHEAGHFIAEETTVFFTVIRNYVDGELEPYFRDHEEYTSLAGDIILVWMEELFADLVAVKLLGPAFTFAYMELQRLIIDLSSDQILTFYINHPCDALRFREQIKALKKDRWKKHINPKQWQKLEEISQFKEQTYKTPFIKDKDPEMLEIWEVLMKFFCRRDIIKKVHDLADEFVKGRENPCGHFIKSAKIIQDCLNHGIVPSFVEENSDMPHPTAIINGAVFFWLSGMDDLYRIVPSIRKEKVKNRAVLEQRVEMWCMKAIEDWLIIKRK